MYCQQTHIISGMGIAKMKYMEYRIERLNVQIPLHTITISQLS